MLKSAFASPRRLVLGACCATAITLLSACASTPAQVNVAETVARDPSLSTFAGLLRTSGVADSLQATGPFTVLAPSNEAFKAVPAKTLDDLNAHPDKLRALLQYHVILGNTSSAGLTNNSKAATLNGAELEISKAGDFMTVESAIVTQADIHASNGLVQVLDTVLIPPVKK